MNRLIFFPFLSLWFVVAGLSWGTTRTAPTCSYSDVSNTLSACVEGDTIVLPAGTATWSSTLTISKGIVLSGSGLGTTVISASAGGTQLILIQPGSNKAIRVTGIGFVDGTYQVHIKGSTNGSYVLDQVRVDHCSFTNGKDNILVEGWVEGLIDHNSFLNGNRDMFIVGDNDYAWNRTIAPGTSHSLFIEDNVFKQTNAGGGGLNENIYHFAGARTTIRHNDFDSTAYTSYDAALYDSHGNQPYWTGPGTADRGQPLIEVYDNTFRYHHSYRVCYIRSGSTLFHDNQFTYVTSSTEIVLSEEDGWQTAFFSPLRTAWPGQDQVNNSFFWNNTRNGAPISDVSFNNASDSVFIVKNRDYWMQAPQAGGGSESFTGSRAGGSQTAPTASDTGSMSFTGAGANAYYGYVSYTYPHPLQGVGTPAPDAPKRLRINY
jgi:hypothetical protein